MNPQIESAFELSTLAGSIGHVSTLLPDAEVSRLMYQAGCLCEDPRLSGFFRRILAYRSKVAALALHKWISEVLLDCKEETKAVLNRNENRQTVCVTTEMLVMALRENGVNIEKPLFLTTSK